MGNFLNEKNLESIQRILSGVCARILNLMNWALRSDKLSSTLIAHNYPELKTKPARIQAGLYSDFVTLTLLLT